MERTMKLFLLFFSLSAILFAQEKQMDTLFFKWERSYLRVYDVTPSQIYLADSGTDETFYFERLRSFKNLKPKRILSLRKYVRTSKYYTKKKKLNDYRFWEHLRSKVVYLVKNQKGKKSYIKVNPRMAVE